VVDRSPDGKKKTLRMPDGRAYTSVTDGAGRLTEFARDGRKFLNQSWRQDGLVESVTSPSGSVQPRYRDQVLSGLLVTPPDAKNVHAGWVEVKYDDRGRTASVSDSTGSAVSIAYDPAGRPSRLSSPGTSVTYDRDEAGRTKSIRTSWGSRQTNILDPGGSIRRVELDQRGSRAAVEYDRGLPTLVRQYDGGEFRIRYHQRGPHLGRVEEIRTPNGLVLKYEYDTSNRVVAVNCDGVYRVEYGYDANGRLVSQGEVQLKNT